MKRSRFGWLAVAVASLVMASLAATIDASAASSGTIAPSARQTTGTVGVQFAVKKFVARGKSLFAVGDAIGTYASAEGTQVTHTPFMSRVKMIKAGSTSARHLQQANRICDILSLNLAPLRLELLGLIVELDAVVLTIKANSAGGLLGGLLCGLAGGTGPTALSKTATGLTKAAKKSGLAAGTGFQVPVSSVTMPPPAAPAPMSSPRQLQRSQDLPPVPAGVCTVLDLVLGPLDLNLLGLMVHLNRTELRITADPTKGLLGSLLCSLAGGPPTPIATPVVPTTG